MPRNPGIEALEGCQEQVLLAIKNNFEIVALHLRNEKILTTKIYENAVGVNELLPLNRRVDIVFQRLNSMVAQNDDHFFTFVRILHIHTNSRETVDILVNNFIEKGGDAEVVKKILTQKKAASSTSFTYREQADHANVLSFRNILGGICLICAIGIGVMIFVSYSNTSSNGNTLQTGNKPHVRNKAGVPDQPTMTVLRNFPGKSGKIDLASRISSSNYKRFGRCLLADETGTTLSSIESSHRGKIQDINDEVFQEWIAGSGKEPVNWDTFLDCLEEAGLKSLMKDIHDEL